LRRWLEALRDPEMELRQPSAVVLAKVWTWH
jgi:hypothetical protein